MTAMFFLIAGLASASTLKEDDYVQLSSDFQHKEITEFARLEDFDSTDDFQAYIDDYVQLCLDRTGGNSSSIPCFVGYKLWDRELNHYYQKLRALVSSEERASLLDSQRLWIQDRDRTITLNSALLDWRYENVNGTMYYAMRAGDAAGAIAPMVKQRALLLQYWVDLKMFGQYRY